MGGAYEKVQQHIQKYLLQATEAAVDEVPFVQDTPDDHEYTFSL